MHPVLALALGIANRQVGGFSRSVHRLRLEQGWLSLHLHVRDGFLYRLGIRQRRLITQKIEEHYTPSTLQTVVG